MAFISKLNTMAAEQGCPMKFRLLTTQEWEIAYRNGGVNKESWLGFSGSVVHPVAELPTNDLHHDMKEISLSFVLILLWWEMKMIRFLLMGCSGIKLRRLSFQYVAYVLSLDDLVKGLQMLVFGCLPILCMEMKNRWNLKQLLLILEQTFWQVNGGRSEMYSDAKIVVICRMDYFDM